MVKVWKTMSYPEMSTLHVFNEHKVVTISVALGVQELSPKTHTSTALWSTTATP